VYTDRGTGYPFETITNVAPLNNEEAEVNLEHTKGEVWLVMFQNSFWDDLKSQKEMAKYQEILEKR